MVDCETFLFCETGLPTPDFVRTSGKELRFDDEKYSQTPIYAPRFLRPANPSVSGSTIGVPGHVVWPDK